MLERDRDRLRHIRDAARRALEISKEVDREELEPEDMRALALVRLLEIIGEAAGQVSEELQDHYPDLPWRQAADMRNVLIHAYFRVNLDVVWRTVTEDIPDLLERVEAILDEAR